MTEVTNFRLDFMIMAGISTRAFLLSSSDLSGWTYYCLNPVSPNRLGPGERNLAWPPMRRRAKCKLPLKARGCRMPWICAGPQIFYLEVAEVPCWLGERNVLAESEASLYWGPGQLSLQWAPLFWKNRVFLLHGKGWRPFQGHRETGLRTLQ